MTPDRFSRRAPKQEAETNPNVPKKAVAIKYDQQTQTAPKVIAKGQGFVAENILSLAQQNALPIYQNKTLVNLLMAIDIDREIPPELYTAVAEILAYVYRLDKKASERHRRDLGLM